MATYTPIFTKPYNDGYEDLPSQDTPITAQTLNDKDSAIENIEDYLNNNPMVDSDIYTDTGIHMGSAPVSNNSSSLGGDNPIEAYRGFASGQANTLTSSASHSGAIGYGNTVSASNGFATGSGNTTSASYARTGGLGNTASSNYSVAEGLNNVAQAESTVCQGEGLIASSRGQFIVGKYNVEDNASTYQVIVGNGTSDNARSNALTISKNGDVVASGEVTDGNGESISDKADITALAPNESGNTVASQAYSAGNYFYKDGYFCEVTADIAQGGTLTENTNYTKSNVADCISKGTYTTTNAILTKVGKTYELNFSGATLPNLQTLINTYVSGNLKAPYRNLVVRVGNEAYVMSISQNKSITIININPWGAITVGDAWQFHGQISFVEE